MAAEAGYRWEREDASSGQYLFENIASGRNPFQTTRLSEILSRFKLSVLDYVASLLFRSRVNVSGS
jgi:hypothetical protein